MLLRLLKAERLKLKRSPVWIAFLLMPIIPALLGTLNYMNNLEILKEEWFSLYTQHTIFTCYFFLPLTVGIYTSYIVYQEENNHNWNKLLTMPVSRGTVFMSKFIMAGFMILISEIWIFVLFVISGKVIGLSSPIPFEHIFTWCALGTLGGLVMAAAQLLVSLVIKNFAVPIGFSFAGGLSGLFFLAKDLGHIWPYSLMAYGMESNAPQELTTEGYPQFIIMCIFYIALFSVLGKLLLTKRDV